MGKEIPSRKSPIRIGISSCLLGVPVRFDGGHKKDSYITDILGSHFEFVPVCPEIEVGMPVPREAVRLEGTADSPRMVGTETGTDWTDRMDRYARQRVRRADLANLSGFIFKSRSPSCGMEKVKRYIRSGAVEEKAVGLFARAFMEHFPNVPSEEEGRLTDAALRESFIVRVFVYHRLQSLFRGRFNRGEMVKFHTAHKFLLLAHSRPHYLQLGQLVAAVRQTPVAVFKERYLALAMACLKLQSTTKKNTNVLLHIIGFVRSHLSDDERREVLSAIDDYHRGHLPLIVPITLIARFVRKYDIKYIKDQVYLCPYPEELMPRNQV